MRHLRHPTHTGTRTHGLAFHVLIVVCLAFSLAANKIRADEERPEPRIGASFDTSDVDKVRWLKHFQASLESYGATCMALSADGDADIQQQQCDYLLRQHIDALGIMPVHAHLLTSQVQRAHSLGIPVLAMGEMISNCELDLFVGFDWVGGGQMQIDALVSESKGAYYLLGHRTVDDHLHQLLQGRVSALKIYVERGVELLGADELAVPMPNIASKATSKVIARQGPMNVVLTTHPALSVGAIQALTLIGSEDETLVSGLDPDLDACRRILGGQQHSSLYFSRADAGKKSAEVIYQLATRQPIQISTTKHNGLIEVPALLVAPKLLTKENLIDVLTNDEIFTRAQLHP